MRQAFRSIMVVALLGLGWLAAPSGIAQADDLLVQVRLDKSVTEVDSSGTIRPVQLSLVVQNLSDKVVRLKISKTYRVALQDFDSNTPLLFGDVADGAVASVYNGDWLTTGLPLAPHSERLIATGSLPGVLTKLQTPDRRIKSGTYLLGVELPPDQLFDEGGVPGWSTTALTIVDAAAGAQVTPTPSQARPETPWQANAYGTESLNSISQYNVGYQFIPQVNGKVTKLGALLNGTGTVRLYDSSGSVLALANVTSKNVWSSTALSTPVDVVAGKTYTVAVLLRTPENVVLVGSYRLLPTPLPKTFGNIKILQSVWQYYTEEMPKNGVTTQMYGQVDIEFVPDAR